MLGRHFRFRKSHGAGLVAGITSHVKWLRQCMSPVLQRAFSSEELLGQSDAIVGEEMYLAQFSCLADAQSSLKNDLHNLCHECV